MKFQKNLEDAVKSADPEWDAFWINYKKLKKLVKELIKSTKDAPEDQLRPKETQFTQMLMRELRKCSSFFLNLNHQLSQRKNWILEGLERFQRNEVTEAMHPKMRLMQACLNFYRDLLLTENYAIMTYCGFSKILKKHDKCSRYKIRDQFMTKFVQGQGFTRYSNVIALLAETEKIFITIKKIESASQGETAPREMKLEGEQQLFIDTLRRMNDEALKIHEQESLPSGSGGTEEEVDLELEEILDGKTESDSGDDKTLADTVPDDCQTALVRKRSRASAESLPYGEQEYGGKSDDADMSTVKVFEQNNGMYNLNK